VAEEFGPYPGVVRDWHDGDTAHIDLDLGFGFELRAYTLDEKPRLSLRTFGINAPELSTAAGKAALAFVQDLCPPETKVTVLSHGWDKYGGRFDGSVRLPAERTVENADASGSTTSDDLATLMLAAGQAVPLKA
jgi:endonuclease YncB( thermonuclease family)